MKRVKILGVPIDAVTMHEALRHVDSLLKDGEKHHIATPNSEMLLEATKNVSFRTILQTSDLNIPDSVGLLIAAKWKGGILPERITGVDFTEKLCRRLGKDQSVFFLGGHNDVGKKAAAVLKSYNPNLVIAGVYEGSPVDTDAAEIVRRINDSGAVLLLVAFGAPSQELWIHQFRSSLVSVRVAIGVGGTFDFLSGSIKRAPKWMQGIGLEWMWRLFLQPSRIGRIWNAVVVFPVRVLFS